MSEKSKSAPITIESNKKFESTCKNFVSMANIEKSDSIKLQYFSSLEKSASILKIPPISIVEIVFQNILFKKPDLIKSPNILFAFVSFLRQTDELTFQKYFYELLYNFVSNYEENEIYFKNYLIQFSLEIFFDAVKNIGENEKDIDVRKKYFGQLMLTDIKEFKEQFFKIVINEKIKIMDNKIKFNFVKNFIEVIIIKNKYQIGVLLLKLIINEINKTSLPDELVEKTISMINKSGFNILLESNKNINDFITFTDLLLENTSKNFINDKDHENLFDFYFTNILNILCIKQEFNINLIQFCFYYYKINKTKILKTIFPEVIYHLSNYAYTNNQISYLFNLICLSDIDVIFPIYQRIIYKNPILSKKANVIKTKFKPSLDNINIIIDNKEENDDKSNDTNDNVKSIINHILFINKEESNIYFLIYLTLYNYIINSSFNINENDYVINFHSLNKTLRIISELIKEKIPKNYSEFLLQFFLDYFSVLFEFCLSIKDIKEYTNIILKTFNNFFTLFKRLANEEEKQLSLVFPSLINLLGKNIKIELIEPILDYFIETYGRKTRQCDMIFKTIKSLLINSDKNNFDNKFFLADKLINLVIESNEHKAFESLFSFCNELLKDKTIFNQNLSQYIINKYSKFYQGALSNLLHNHILSKFDESFIQKKFAIDNMTDDDYNTLNTINNIYLQDKTTNLNEIVDKLYGDDYKTITNIFNELFEYMDKEDNNKNVIIFNLSENLLEKYTDMKRNLNNIIDFYSFIKQDYIQNNTFFKSNKKIIQIYGITYYLVYLLTQYLSIKIENENKIEKEEEKKVEVDKLMILFNYIHEVILNKEIKNNYFKAFFINRLLCDKKILEFFLVKHTNILVNEQIQQKELDLSKLRELSCNLNKKKVSKIIELLKVIPLSIVLMKQLILQIFSYESDTILNPKKVDIYSRHASKYHIIKTLNTNKLITKIKDLNNTNGDKNIPNKNLDDITLSINSSFSKLFFDFIADLTKKENLELNQPYYLFCLDNDIFYSYYNSLCDFYDFDYSILEFYSLIRNKECNLEYKEKFMYFLKQFGFVENVLLFNLRIFSEEMTFDKIISIQKEHHSEKMSSILCDIIIYLLNNLLKYNSYQDFAENTIKNIINNIFRYTTNLLLLLREDKSSKEKTKIELNYLVKLINYIFEIFSTENNNLTNKQLPKKSDLAVNTKLIKNINEIIDKKYNPKNPKCYNKENKDLFQFIQEQENLNNKKEKNIKDIYNYIEEEIFISNYLDNPKKYPFPIEQFMDKCGYNK